MSSARLLVSGGRQMLVSAYDPPPIRRRGHPAVPSNLASPARSLSRATRQFGARAGRLAAGRRERRLQWRPAARRSPDQLADRYWARSLPERQSVGNPRVPRLPSSSRGGKGARGHAAGALCVRFPSPRPGGAHKGCRSHVPAFRLGDAGLRQWRGSTGACCLGVTPATQRTPPDSTGAGVSPMASRHLGAAPRTAARGC